jgi:hypothetical protein
LSYFVHGLWGDSSGIDGINHGHRRSNINYLGQTKFPEISSLVSAPVNSAAVAEPSMQIEPIAVMTTRSSARMIG